MAREPGTKEAPAASPEQREVDRLKSEITSLKGQLRHAAPAKEVLPVKFETVDGEEAARFQRVGGHLISILKRFPHRPYTAGKKYGFTETKEELDQLVNSAKEAGIL